ncbi:hypothetical protein [Stenotrophomonas sp.]|uniref:hypothetical protein n=1 Tax=Stenotrophomonas sp. TaxID=69392 RepID=UPI0028968762|nr:hypothetical protein [Stenotrophomonas sp.]
MKRLVMWFALTAVTLASGCRGDQGSSPLGGDCGGGADTACRVTFRSLLVAPGQFDGRVIRIEGYLGVSMRFFSLHASKELFDAGVSDEVALRLRGPMQLQEKIFNEYAYTWVSVIGVFKLRKKNGTTDDLLIGELAPPIEVRSLQPLGANQRAEFGEVVLDLEDLN